MVRVYGAKMSPQWELVGSQMVSDGFDTDEFGFFSDV